MSSWSVFNVFSPDFCDKFISKTLLHILYITIYIDLKAIITTKTNDQIYPDKTQLFQYRYLDHRLLEYPFLVICSLPWYSHSYRFENNGLTFLSKLFSICIFQICRIYVQSFLCTCESIWKCIFCTTITTLSCKNASLHLI